MKAKGILAFFLFFSAFCLYGQVDSLRIPDRPARDTLPRDTLPDRADSLQIESPAYRLSSDTLSEKVDYFARDSIVYDREGGGVLHLYGQATVTYTSIKLTADHIVYDMDNGIVTAEGWPDSSGQVVGTPVFEDGTQQFNAERMRYNFRSRKGIIYGVTTTYDDVVVKGAQSKFVSAGQDSLSERNDQVFSKGALITTCQHDEPHFGIRSNKQKVIPGKLVVVGPSNLEIMKVPTPLWLPFGFFPVTKQRSTGLLFPQDYEYSEQWGFGLRGVGWFFPLSDHMNLALRTNIYLKGTFGINLSSQYRKRYKYNGNLFFGYDNRRQEDLSTGEVARIQSFALRISHNQDRAAHPTNTLGGSINIQGNLYQSRDQNDAQNVLENTLNSNFSFRKNWQDKPIAFSLGLTHSQNTRTRQVTINFPDANFRTQNIYPFRRPGGRGSQALESVVLTYSAELKNRFQTTDTALFTRETLENAQFGMRQRASLSNSIKLFRFINFNPSLNYEEYWHLKTLRKDFDPTPTVDSTEIIVNGEFIGFDYDTTGFGTVTERLRPGFDSWRRMSASVSLNTQLFGTLQFRKGWLRGFRHTLKPSIGLSLTPDLFQDRYLQTVQTDSRFPNEVDDYNIFDRAIFGAPRQSGLAFLLNYSLNNIFEAKYWSKKDSVAKKFKIFDNVVINGNYNFAADSLNWSPIAMRGTHRLFRGLTTISLSANFDPYAVDERGRRINTFYWEQKRKPLRFVNFSARVATSLTFGRIRDLFRPEGGGPGGGQGRSGSRQPGGRSQDQGGAASGFFKLLENFSVNHNLVMDLQNLPDGRDTFRISVNSINFRGAIELTQNWRIVVGNFGYDFVQERLSYPSVGFFRDLHCWELGMNWAPQRGTYTFFIRVKPGPLDFLNVPYERNNADAVRAFQ